MPSTLPASSSTRHAKDLENASNKSANSQNNAAKNHDSDKKKERRKILTNQFIYAFSAALGVVTNTLFVAIFTLLFFNGTSIAQNTVVTVEYVLAWFGVNFAVEVVSFSLITPPIVLALKAAKLTK